MDYQEQLNEIAKLDGWEERNEPEGSTNPTCWYKNGDRYPSGKDWRPPYLKSRDAIVPVIEKQPMETWGEIQRLLHIEREFIYLATPHQLCEALLRATGKWKD